MRLYSAVSYLNCVVFMLLTYTIVSITSTILIESSKKLEINYKTQEYILAMITYFDTLITIILIHLQFMFMNKCYKLLCNPFRLEINNILNKQLNEIQLTILDTEPTTSNQNTNNDSETIDINSSTDATGLAPTHTSDLKQNGYRDGFEPMSSVSRDPPPSYIELYLCNLCPII